MPGFTENTKVWFEGLPKWYPAGTLEQLKPLFDGNSPQPTASTDETLPTEHASDSTVDDQSTIDTETLSTGDYAHQNHENRESSGDAIGTQLPPSPPQRFAPGYIPRRELPAEPCPPTYLGWSVFLMVCCCSPLSLAAVICSIIVTSYYNSGNLDKARKVSEITAWLIMVSFALGLIPVMFVSALFN